MTFEQRLARIEELEKKRTQGEWDCHDMGPTLVGRPGKKDMPVHGWDDAEFIAACSTEVSFLLESVRVMREALNYYSDAEEWIDYKAQGKASDGKIYPIDSKFDHDNYGGKAREALSKIEEIAKR